MLKRLFCKHDYKLIDKYWTFDSPSLSYKIWWAKTYCPKCKSKKIFKDYEYKNYLIIKQIDEDYRRDK